MVSLEKRPQHIGQMGHGLIKRCLRAQNAKPMTTPLKAQNRRFLVETDVWRSFERNHPHVAGCMHIYIYIYICIYIFFSGVSVSSPYSVSTCFA